MFLIDVNLLVDLVSLFVRDFEWDLRVCLFVTLTRRKGSWYTWSGSRLQVVRVFNSSLACTMLLLGPCACNEPGGCH